MLFSCKITHSVLSYLERRGEDLEALNDKCDWPSEFLRDPSSWLEAEKMENLLKLIEIEYGQNPHDSGTDDLLVVGVGHQSKDLRSWGVLDSVLRMVQTPKDLFAQPERLLSYFISPAPPVGEIRRQTDSVGFVLPVSEMQFPLVTSYLRAALEALPTYISKPMATVTWENSRVVISWSESQVSLFGSEASSELSLHPELVRNILHNLESSQKQLEEMKRELIAKDEEIAALKSLSVAAPAVVGAVEGAASPAVALSADNHDRLAEALHGLFRLGDYVARGQQLITLLIGQGRGNSQVREAMRRVDWDFVSTEAPKTVRKAVDDLQEIQRQQPQLESESSIIPVERERHVERKPAVQMASRTSSLLDHPENQKSFDGFSLSP